MAVAAYAVTAPVIARASTLTKNDLSLVISFAVAVFFVSRLAEVRTKAYAILSGLALGALAGTKYTGAFYAVVIIILAMAQCLAAPKPETPAGAGLGMGGLWALVFISALVVGGPWYLRNELAFGNPFYPAKVEIGGLTLFTGRDMRELVPYAYSVGWDVEALIRAWPFFVQAYGALIPLIAMGVLGLGWAMARGTRPLSRFLGLLCLAPACFMVFLHQPANWPVPGFIQHDYLFNMRYLLPWFVSSLVAGSVYVTGLKGGERLAAALLLVGAVVNLVVWARWWWVLLAIVLAGGVGSWAVCGRQFGWQWAIPVRPIAPLVAVAVVGGMAVGVSMLRAQLQYHPVYGYPADEKGGLGTAVAYVHRTLKGQRIIAYGAGQIFPLYGDDLSNAVFALEEGLSPASFLAECDIRKADYVVIFPSRPEYRGGAGVGGMSELGLALMATYPDRFLLAFQSGETYLLRVLPPHR
jgi:hypothetical protein